MNIDPWTIYWITRIDDMLGCLILVACLTLIPLLFYIVTTIIRLIDPDMKEMIGMKDKARKLVLKWTLPAFILSALLITFTPTEKDLVKMFVIPRIVNNQSLKDLPAVAEKLIRDYLEEGEKK